MTTFLNRLSQSATTRVQVSSAFAGTATYHDGLAYDESGPDLLVVNYAGTPAFYQAGIGFTAAGEMCVVDASAGLPADTFHQSGLPISAAQNRLCVDPTNAVLYWHQGVPFTTVFAVAVDGTPVVTTLIGRVVITLSEDAEGNSPELGQLYFGSSGATALYYTNKATFLSDNPGLALETFSGIAPAGSFTTTLPAFSGFSFTSDGSTRYVFDSAYGSGAPFCSIWDNALPGQRGIILDFSPAVTAVGFNIALSGGGFCNIDFYDDSLNIIDAEFSFPHNRVIFDTFSGLATGGGTPPSATERVTATGDTRVTATGDTRVIA